jgi:hypothetical protein
MLADFGHTLTDFFAAIPPDGYEVMYKIEGVHRDWQSYVPGVEQSICSPVLVRARGLRHSGSGIQLS